MSTQLRMRALFALLAALVLALGVAACGDDDSDTETTEEASSSGTAIEENPDNNGVQLTIGSKNFTEQFILGEIYAQALEAAGYDVSTDLNLGSEQVALKALENGEISGYPEYTSTALTVVLRGARPRTSRAMPRRPPTRPPRSSRSRAWPPSRRPRSSTPTRSGCSRDRRGARRDARSPTSRARPRT